MMLNKTYPAGRDVDDTNVVAFVSRTEANEIER